MQYYTGQNARREAFNAGKKEDKKNKEIAFLKGDGNSALVKQWIGNNAV